MPVDACRIDDLVLRLPGLRADDAERLARAVTRRVEEGLPPRRRPLHLGRLDLRLSLPAGLSVETQAERIADAILHHIRAEGG